MNRAAQDFSAGPLAFRLDADTGFVRDLRYHGHEILRGIYPAARDAEWRTLVPEAGAIEVREEGETVRVAAGGARLWRADGFAMDRGNRSAREWTVELPLGAGKVVHDSTTNRTGLCVLHPAEIAGAPCVIEHTDGRREAGWFPREISPHQPFRDIRAISHVVGRAEVAVRLEGEVFEMEDQRNWTDASFKTYCRPLDWPCPYRLAAGAEIDHTVTVEVRGEMPLVPPANVAAGHEPDLTALRLPAIGFTLPSVIPPACRERVRALRPAHVRVEATPQTLSTTLDWAREDAAFLDCTLIVALRGANAPVPREKLPSRCVVHLFDGAGNAAPAEDIAAWRGEGHETIATGTLHHFTELNRARPPVHGAHTHTVFGINAQCHAGDDDSILETLTQHCAVASAAHRIGAERPVSVAPISLGRQPDAVDARLHTDFAARWLRGSLARFAAAQCVESATYFQMHGPAGFLREDAETPVERLLLTLAERRTSRPV